MLSPIGFIDESNTGLCRNLIPNLSKITLLSSCKSKTIKLIASNDKLEIDERNSISQFVNRYLEDQSVQCFKIMKRTWDEALDLNVIAFEGKNLASFVHTAYKGMLEFEKSYSEHIPELPEFIKNLESKLTGSYYYSENPHLKEALDKQIENRKNREIIPIDQGFFEKQ